MTLGMIVEGHGEVAAAPILVRRFGLERDDPVYIDVQSPVRVPRGKMTNVPGELERAIELAVPAIAGAALLVLLDADDDCPADLGPRLLHRARIAAAGRFPTAVVAAKIEYEAWLIAGAESLRGRRGLPADLTAPPDPESIVGAKAWLSRRIQGGTYSEILEQPALTSALDIATARQRAPSLDKLCRDIDRLIQEVMSPNPGL